MKFLLLLLLALPMVPAKAAAVNCASVSPSSVRLAFETSRYARGENPQHMSLTTEMPIIQPQADGTCRTVMNTHDWETGEPAGILTLQFTVVYYPCKEAPLIPVAPDTPGACPWVYLQAFPAS